MPGAERAADLAARAGRLWEELAARAGEGPLLCVTHSGTLQWIIKTTFGGTRLDAGGAHRQLRRLPLPRGQPPAPGAGAALRGVVPAGLPAISRAGARGPPVSETLKGEP